jgi:hypothetical protein
VVARPFIVIKVNAENFTLQQWSNRNTFFK